MSQRFEIFVFKNCGNSELCKKAYSSLLNKTNKISSRMCSEIPALRGAEVNIILTDDDTIKDLNENFRKVEGATDVLAFPLGDGCSGEIWLGPNIIFENASTYGEEFEVELLRVVIHGILHLAGFEHKGRFEKGRKSAQEPMFVIQEKLLKAI